MLDLEKKYTGLTEKQNQLMRDISEGLSDKDIALKNGVATATVRHQRFMLREKAKQAKLYLAIFEATEKAAKHLPKDELLPPHAGATTVDARYVMTKEEQKKVLTNFFLPGDDLKLKTMPSKEKRKLVILRRIAEEFDPRKQYTEMEINKVLKGIYPDIASIRRFLIDYGFFERTSDGRSYWIKKV